MAYVDPILMDILTSGDTIPQNPQINLSFNEILIKHFGGFTIQDANGGWVDDSGKRYDEYTVVVYISDTDLESVHKAADDLIKEFNQSSVLIQANETKTEFYSTEQQ